MTQPKFAPILADDEVRPTARLAPARPWKLHRPGEFQLSNRPVGIGAGTPGPDQGYALRLAEAFVDRLVLAEGEHTDDVIVGAVAIATRRAAEFGRAPVATDIEIALAYFGFLDEAPADLVTFRKTLFSGAGHDYWEQRELAHAVPSETLRLSLVEIREHPDAWRELAASRS
jgi:hypothetical protein